MEGVGQNTKQEKAHLQPRILMTDDEEKNKDKESAEGESTPPMSRGFIICQLMGLFALLLLIYLITAPVVYYLRTKVPPVMSDEFTQILLFSVVAGILFACIVPAIILWNRRQYYKSPRKTKSQGEESKGGLPFLEWALRHQGWFLIICLPLSFIATSIAVFSLIALIVKLFIEQNFSDILKNFAEIPVFSLALVVASVTFAVTMWRGYLAYEQIRKSDRQNSLIRQQLDIALQQTGAAQEQSKSAQEQSSSAQEQTKAAREQIEATKLQMEQAQRQTEQAQKQFELAQRQRTEEQFKEALETIEKSSDIRSRVFALKILEELYDDVNDDQKETIFSTALSLLASNYHRNVPPLVRQRALDLLVEKKFLSKERIQKTYTDEDEILKNLARTSMNGKVLSGLYIAKRKIDKDSGKRTTLDLSGISLGNGCQLDGADLSGINLSDADFQGSSYKETNLKEVTMFGVNFSRTKFINIKELLLSDMLKWEWAYCVEQPEIEIRGWKEWNEGLNKIIDLGEHPKVDPPRKVFCERPYYYREPDLYTEQDFLIRLCLAIEKMKAKKLKSTLIPRTSEALAAWKAFAEEQGEELNARMFGLDHLSMTPEVWDYLKILTERIVEDSSTGQLKVRAISVIKSWEEWKKLVKKTKKKPEGAKDEVWDYMQRLAAEDALYPPGVVGDDEREEEG